MVPLRATGPELFVATMIKFLSNYYCTLGENLTHMKSLKLKSYPSENISNFWSTILIDAGILESAGAFNPEYLG